MRRPPNLRAPRSARRSQGAFRSEAQFSPERVPRALAYREAGVSKTPDPVLATNRPAFAVCAAGGVPRVAAASWGVMPGAPGWRVADPVRRERVSDRLSASPRVGGAVRRGVPCVLTGEYAGRELRRR